MLRASVVVLALLSLAGCLELGGGGGGGSDGSAPQVTPPVVVEPVDPPVTPPVVPPVAPPVEPPVVPPVLPPVEPPVTPPVEPPIEPPVTPPVEPPVVPEETFPEPAAAVIDEVDALGFYDRDATDQPRAVRNDLTGDLSAMLQLVQSHSMDPQGNEAKNMPRLTSEREALLLVTPEPALGALRSLRVSVSRDGQPLGELALRQPDELFRADRAGSDSRHDVVYSRRAWSAVLPWDWVKPGMSLRLTDDQGRTGERAAADFDFAAPAQLVVQAIRVGMLTPPVAEGGHWFLNQPAKAATDYFQTVPIARLIASQYEDVQLPRVMVASGVIYDTASAGTGDVYSGDMRENTAKSTFSTGINLANLGVTSAGMASQENPHLAQAAVIHHARGMYSNGVVSHGLSGGNGILTLYSSVGNEFSHEIGHHYGLGHYPGQQGDNYFWAGHHHDSGWGYIGHRKRMRANLHWTRGKNDGMGGMPVYADAYSFGSDAMSGGHYASSLSSYTHYTGYSTKTRIQPSVDKAVVAADSPTGYRKWNATTRQMEVFDARVPNSTRIWYNRADGKYLAPRRQGVAVFTLLGGYDPVANTAVLYPPLRGNWGHVFDLPAAQADAAGKQCWLEVAFAGGRSQQIAVAPLRLGSNANKLHVNLAQDEQPLSAALQCRESAVELPVELASVAFPQGLPAMPAPIIVGQEQGYSALRAVELPQLQAALEPLASQAVLTLSGQTRVLFDSYADNPEGLSPAAQAVISRVREQENKALRLNRWLDAYGSRLARSPRAEQALTELLLTLGLDSTPLLPAEQLLTMSNRNCVRVERVDGVLQPYVAAPAQCSGSVEERWRVDASGRIHSAADLGQCLTDAGSITLTACDAQKDAQVWDFSALPQLKRGGRCMDLSGGYLTNGRGSLISYGCTGGGNQKWYGLSLNDNLLLPLLRSRNLPAFLGYAERRAAAVAP